jgi:hypothetical protein
VCVGGTTGSGRDGSDEPTVSGRALAGVRGRKPLVRLGLAPQLEGAPQEQPTFLVAIPLDQLLDARKLCRSDARKLCRSIDVWRNHSISLWETSRPRCPLLDSADRLQQSHLCREVRMVHEPLAELRSTAAVHGGAPLVAVDGDVDTRWAPWVARGRVHDRRVRRRFVVSAALCQNNTSSEDSRRTIMLDPHVVFIWAACKCGRLVIRRGRHVRNGTGGYRLLLRWAVPSPTSTTLRGATHE